MRGGGVCRQRGARRAVAVGAVHSDGVPGGGGGLPHRSVEGDGSARGPRSRQLCWLLSASNAGPNHAPTDESPDHRADWWPIARPHHRGTIGKAHCGAVGVADNRTDWGSHAPTHCGSNHNPHSAAVRVANGGAEWSAHRDTDGRPDVSALCTADAWPNGTPDGIAERRPHSRAVCGPHINADHETERGSVGDADRVANRGA